MHGFIVPPPPPGSHSQTTSGDVEVIIPPPILVVPPGPLPIPRPLPPLVQAEHDVKPLHYAHTWEAAKTWAASNSVDNNPLFRYVKNDEQPNAAVKTIDTSLYAGILSLSIGKSIALTIDDGKDFVLVSPPPQVNDNPGAIRRAGDWVTDGFHAILTRKSGTQEQRRRNQELQDERRAAIERSIGQEKVNTMFEIVALSTAPDILRYDNANKLLKSIISLSDVTGQGIWLQLDVERETEFYEQHGFQIVSQFLLGLGQPNPVLVQILVREPVPREGNERL